MDNLLCKGHRGHALEASQERLTTEEARGHLLSEKNECAEQTESWP